MLEELKKILRITSDEFDDEINSLISECKEDLKLSGINEDLVIETNLLIKRAIRLYVKAYFGYDNKDFEKLLASYHSLKSHLIVSDDYGSDLE
jgi:uncharacterized phage protein (predicted DNA packaging)